MRPRPCKSGSLAGSASANNNGRKATEWPSKIASHGQYVKLRVRSLKRPDFLESGLTERRTVLEHEFCGSRRHIVSSLPCVLFHFNREHSGDRVGWLGARLCIAGLTTSYKTTIAQLQTFALDGLH